MCYFVVCLLLFTACHYPRPDLQKEGMSDQVKDSLTYLAERHYTYNTNFEVQADSVVLERLPVKDSFISLYRGDRVVVAEFAIHPADSVDSVWVKLAHSQEAQGWIREKDLIHSFVPTDSISQFIYLFSDTHASYFVIVFALFMGAYLFRAFRRKQLQMVYFNDIANTARYVNTITSSNLISKTRIRPDYPLIGLTLSYTFNQFKLKNGLSNNSKDLFEGTNH